MALKLKPLVSVPAFSYSYCLLPLPKVSGLFIKQCTFRWSATKMAATELESTTSTATKVIDSHLHVWASAEEVTNILTFGQPTFFNYILISSRTQNRHVLTGFLFLVPIFIKAADKYPYFPGQEPTLPGNVDFLLQVRKLTNCFTFSISFLFLL